MQHSPTEIVAFGFLESGPKRESQRSMNSFTTSSGGILPSANTKTCFSGDAKCNYVTLNAEALQEVIGIVALLAGADHVRNVVALVQLLELAQLEVTRHLPISRFQISSTPVIKNRMPLISRKVGGISIS